MKKVFSAFRLCKSSTSREEVTENTKPGDAKGSKDDSRRLSKMHTQMRGLRWVFYTVETGCWAG